MPPGGLAPGVTLAPAFVPLAGAPGVRAGAGVGGALAFVVVFVEEDEEPPDVWAYTAATIAKTAAIGRR